MFTVPNFLRRSDPTDWTGFSGGHLEEYFLQLLWLAMNVHSEQDLAIAMTDDRLLYEFLIFTLPSKYYNVSTEPLLLDVTMLMIHFCDLHQTYNLDVLQTSTLFLIELQIDGKPWIYTLHISALSLGAQLVTVQDFACFNYLNEKPVIYCTDIMYVSAPYIGF